MADTTIHLVCGDFPGIDEYFNFYVNDIKKLDSPTETFKTITIHVPRCSGEGIDTYSARITNFIVKAVYITMHPGVELTQMPNVFADTYTDADTSFNRADPEKYDHEVFEASTPITIENLGKKSFAIEAHKIPRNIRLDDIGLSRAGLRGLFHEFLHPLYAEQSALLVATRVRIKNVPFVPPKSHHRIQQVMHNAVPKRRRKNFPNHGIMSNESLAPARVVSPIDDIIS